MIKKIFIAIFLASAIGCGGGYQVNEEPSTPQAAASSTPDRPTLESKIAALLTAVAASKNDAAVKTILKSQLEKASAKLQEESLDDGELESIASTLDTIEAQNAIAQNSITATSATTGSSSTASTSSSSSTTASSSMLNLTQLSTDSGTPLTSKSNATTFTQLGLFTSDYVSSTAGSGLIFGKGATTGDTYSTIDAVKSTGGADLVLQGSGGNVGIGTTSPGSLLDIRGGHLRVGSNTFAKGTLSSGEIAVDNGSTDSPGIHFYTAANTNWGLDNSGGTLRFVTNLDEAGGVARALMDGAGRFTLTYPGASYMRLTDTAANGGSFDLQSTVVGVTSTFYLTNSITPLLAVQSGGNVGIGTTTPGYLLTVNGQPAANGYTLFTNYSDRRLKQNIKALEGGILEKVLALKPSSFYYNKLTGYDDKTRSRKIHGFIAQDLKGVFPEMVAETKIGEKNYLDTNLSFLQVYIVKAIQELKSSFDKLFESQSERIKNLEAENSKLKENDEQMKSALCELHPNLSFCSH